MFISFPIYVSLIILTIIMIILIIYLSLTADKTKEDSFDEVSATKENKSPNNHSKIDQTEIPNEPQLSNSPFDNFTDSQNQHIFPKTQENAEPFILPYPKDNKF